MSDDIPDWAIEKALAATVDADWFGGRPWSLQTLKRDARGKVPYAVLVYAFARFIAQHEQPPVDPDVEEAIELVIRDGVCRTENQSAAIREGRAGADKVALALAAIKRGRELAK